MKDINYLSKCGNLLKNLLNPESHIDIIRFWTYETRVYSLMWEINDPDYAEEGDERKLVDVLQQLYDYCRYKLRWMDNKFAIEIRVDPGWHIFVGYWDSHVCIGQAILPNMYPPKMQADNWGCPKYISFR